MKGWHSRGPESLHCTLALHCPPSLTLGRHSHFHATQPGLHTQELTLERVRHTMWGLRQSVSELQGNKVAEMQGAARNKRVNRERGKEGGQCSITQVDNYHITSFQS